MLIVSAAIIAASPNDPFFWLTPAVTIDASTRSRLEHGEVIVRVLPAVDAEVGIFAAARLNAEPELLAAWAQSVDQLKKSPYVLVVRRFSDPPVLEDLQDLMLDDFDVEAIRGCKPGGCELKLAAGEIDALRRNIEARDPLWKDAVQRQFRSLVLDRVLAFDAGGFSALSEYVDRRKPVDPRVTAGALLSRSPYLQSAALAGDDTETFFYWSREQYGTGKPVISVTHVSIVRPHDGAVRVAVISREVMATHYRNASLGMTAVTEDEAGRRHLVYVNRSQLDVLGGIFGAWKRAIVEGRLKSETVDVFSEVRRRIESGPPLE